MITLPAKTLSDALGLALASVETKTTIPILGFVLIEATKNAVKLTATDLDTFMSLNLAVDKSSEGSLCISAKKLRNLIALMDGDVSISSKAIQCGMSVYELPMRESSDFPRIERAAESKGIINGSLLAEMVRAASVAASTNPHDTEQSKTILFEARDGVLSIVGCDQKRLSLAQTKLDAEFYAVTPLRAALALASFADGSDSVEMFCGESLFTLRSDRGESGSRLSANKWPAWEMLLTASNEHEIEIDPNVLVPMVKRAILTTDGVLAGLKFTLGKSNAVVTTRDQDAGSGKESFPIECASLNGDDFIIGVPGKQLLDLFKVCKGKAVWALGTPNRQMLFTMVEPLAFDFKYIVMPIRVDAL